MCIDGRAGSAGGGDTGESVVGGIMFNMDETGIDIAFTETNGENGEGAGAAGHNS